MRVLVIVERVMTGSRMSIAVDVPSSTMLATNGSIEERMEGRLAAVEAACVDMLQNGWELVTFRTV